MGIAELRSITTCFIISAVVNGALLWSVFHYFQLLWLCFSSKNDASKLSNTYSSVWNLTQLLNFHDATCQKYAQQQKQQQQQRGYRVNSSIYIALFSIGEAVMRWAPSCWETCIHVEVTLMTNSPITLFHTRIIIIHPVPTKPAQE